MTAVNNPVLGHCTCPVCGSGRATVHQQAKGKPFLYTRFCDNDACSYKGKSCQKKDDETQLKIWQTLEPIKGEGVEIKEPPVIARQQKPSQKPSEPANHQGSEWSPEQEITVQNVVEPKGEEVEKPSKNQGLVMVLGLAAAGLIAMSLRAA